MPRLPSVQDFGARPEIRSQGGVVSYRSNTGAEGVETQAIQGFANTLQQVANQIEKVQLENDTIHAEDALNRLREKQLEMSIGEDGFSNKRGADAVTKPLFDDYTKRFDSEVNRIGESLGNQRQRDLFTSRANMVGLQYRQDILNHVRKESDVHATNVFKSTLETEYRNALERYQDPAGIALSITRTNAAIENEGRRKGWADDVVEGAKRQAASGIHSSVVKRFLANDQDISASNYYKANKSAIVGDDSIEVEKALEIGSTRGEAQRQADRILASSRGDLTFALQEVRKINNPKVRDAATSLVKNMVAENKAAEKEREDEVFTHAFGVVNRTGNVDKIEPDVQARLSPTALAVLDKRAEEIKQGKTPVTDDKAWSEFYTVSRNSKKLADMPEAEFFGKYWLNFDEEKRERASQLREAAIKAHRDDNKDAKEFLRNDVSLTNLVKGQVINAGIIDAKKQPKDYTQEEESLLANATIEASKRLEQLQIAKKGKATAEEEAAVVREVLMPHIKVRIARPWLWDTTKSMGELTEAEKPLAYVEYDMVPVDERAELAARARSLGVKATDDQIARAYSVLVTTTNLPASDRRARIDAILRGK